MVGVQWKTGFFREGKALNRNCVNKKNWKKNKFSDLHLIHAPMWRQCCYSRMVLKLPAVGMLDHIRVTLFPFLVTNRGIRTGLRDSNTFCLSLSRILARTREREKEKKKKTGLELHHTTDQRVSQTYPNNVIFLGKLSQLEHLTPVQCLVQIRQLGVLIFQVHVLDFGCSLDFHTLWALRKKDWHHMLERLWRWRQCAGRNCSTCWLLWMVHEQNFHRIILQERKERRAKEWEKMSKWKLFYFDCAILCCVPPHKIFPETRKWARKCEKCLVFWLKITELYTYAEKIERKGARAFYRFKNL